MGKISFVIGILLLAGCGAIKESEEKTSDDSRLREYEATFRPSDFDQPLKDLFPEINDSSAKDSSDISGAVTQQTQEQAQGYRVQVFATTSYDDATKLKTTLEEQFGDEWFYLVYDAPTYKLRAGNFLERYEADRFGRLLGEKGYKDAWVVPERVYKNPPPRAGRSRSGQK